MHSKTYGVLVIQARFCDVHFREGFDYSTSLASPHIFLNACAVICYQSLHFSII